MRLVLRCAPVSLQACAVRQGDDRPGHLPDVRPSVLRSDGDPKEGLHRRSPQEVPPHSRVHLASSAGAFDR